MAQRADLLERHIAPRLGGYNLNEISRAVLQDFRRDMLRDGATAKTVNSVWRVLSACLGSAVEDGALQINPCAGIKSLRVDPPKRTVINEHDVARIFEALTGQPRDARLFALMVFAGLRPAEAIALRWDSVKDHTIVVGVSAQNGKITRGKIMATFGYGKRLTELMEKDGVKVRNLAALVDTDPAMISRYRNSKNCPSLEMAVKIALAMNRPITDFLPDGGLNPPPVSRPTKSSIRR